jgi:cAMP-dependent protein kinase regulator
MFKALNDEELDVVVSAMDEAKFAPGDSVIKQGDAGAVLFVVEEGELDCYKLFDGASEDKFLKTFTQGDAFGELALLYNAPRAATIKAKTNAHCWVLDRNTFNHIVKDASQKKREQYETFLSGVPILASVDDYERSKICDSIKEENFAQGNTVIEQG